MAGKDIAIQLQEEYDQLHKQLTEKEWVEYRIRNTTCSQQELTNILALKTETQAKIHALTETAMQNNVTLIPPKDLHNSDKTVHTNAIPNIVPFDIDDALMPEEKEEIQQTALNDFMSIVILEGVINFHDKCCLPESELYDLLTKDEAYAINFIYENGLCTTSQQTISNFKSECFPVLVKYMMGSNEKIPTTHLSYKLLKERVTYLSAKYSDTIISTSPPKNGSIPKANDIFPSLQSDKNAMVKREAMLDQAIYALPAVDKPVSIKLPIYELPKEILPENMEVLEEEAKRQEEKEKQDQLNAKQDQIKSENNQINKQGSENNKPIIEELKNSQDKNNIQDKKQNIEEQKVEKLSKGKKRRMKKQEKAKQKGKTGAWYKQVEPPQVNVDEIQQKMRDAIKREDDEDGNEWIVDTKHNKKEKSEKKEENKKEKEKENGEKINNKEKHTNIGDNLSTPKEVPQPDYEIVSAKKKKSKKKM